MSAVHARDTVLIEPIDPSLLREPLDFLLVEHYRLRAALTLLDNLTRARASGDVRRRVAQALLAFFRVDLAHHVEDEQRDVFPLLRRRVGRCSELIGVIDQLQSEHAADDHATEALAAMLAEVAAHPTAEVGMRLRIAAASFVQSQRRHLAWESAVVLPMLRTHLTAADQRELGRRMAVRRGIKPDRPARPAAGARS